MFDLPMIEGWIWYAYAMENDGWLSFSGIRRKGVGYVGMQRETLVAEAKKAYGWS